MSNSAGKGDKPRPVDLKKWDENYDKIFRREKTKVHQGELLRLESSMFDVPNLESDVDLDKSAEEAWDKVLSSIEEKKEQVSDGYQSWSKCKRPDCGLHVVRPGKVQCWCDEEGGPQE